MKAVEYIVISAAIFFGASVFFAILKAAGLLSISWGTAFLPLAIYGAVMIPVLSVTLFVFWYFVGRKKNKSSQKIDSDITKITKEEI